MYLTFGNLERQFGFYFKVKTNQGRWNLNQNEEYLLVMMMDQNLSNITMQKPAKFLPLEISVSYLSQMITPHQSLSQSYLMHLVRGSLGEAHSQHQAVKVIA